MRFIVLFPLVLFILHAPVGLQAQISEYPSLSPEGTLTQRAGFTDVSVRYERPAVRDRVIFGELVPWNKVWRTGAGYSTLISFSRDVKVGGQQIEAGKYALFTVPRPDTWTVIINKDTTLYGAYGYDESKDVARFKVPSTHSSRFYESLTIDLDVVPNDIMLYISWGHTQVSFLIDTQADEEVMAYIEEKLMTGQVRDDEQLASAADYLVYRRENMLQALELAKKAVEINPMSGFGISLQVDINTWLERYDEALKMIEVGKEFTRKRDLPTEEDRRVELEGWDKKAASIRALRDKKY